MVRNCYSAELLCCVVVMVRNCYGAEFLWCGIVMMQNYVAELL